MPKLTFDPSRHVYRLDGNIIPSVTQIMKPLSQKAYDGIDPAIMEKAAARGTAVHDACEFYARYGADECPDEYCGYMAAYKRWFDDYHVKPIQTEQMLYHPWMLYAGTLDLIAEVDGEVMLVDYKTTSSIKDMLTRVQLEAYSRMLYVHGNDVPGRAILQLRGDGNYTFKKYESPDM